MRKKLTLATSICFAFSSVGSKSSWQDEEKRSLTPRTLAIEPLHHQLRSNSGTPKLYIEETPRSEKWKKIHEKKDNQIRSISPISDETDSNSSSFSPKSTPTKSSPRRLTPPSSGERESTNVRKRRGFSTDSQPSRTLFSRNPEKLYQTMVNNKDDTVTIYYFINLNPTFKDNPPCFICKLPATTVPTNYVFSFRLLDEIQTSKGEVDNLFDELGEKTQEHEAKRPENEMLEEVSSRGRSTILCEHFEELIAKSNIDEKDDEDQANLNSKVNGIIFNNNMPIIEELFSFNHDFGVNLEKAALRQKMIRQSGTLSLDDPATHIVNLFRIKDVDYPKAKDLRTKADKELQDLNLHLQLLMIHLTEVDWLIHKFPKSKHLNTNILRLRISNEIESIQNEIKEINGKIGFYMSYNPDQMRSDVYRIVDKICEYISSKDHINKFLTILVHFQ